MSEVYVPPAVPTTPESPTGVPWMSQKAVKIVVLVLSLAVVILGVLVVQYPDVKAFTTALALVSAVGGVFGVSSQGIRSSSKGFAKLGAMALLAGGGALTSCALTMRNNTPVAVVAAAEISTCGPGGVALYEEIKGDFDRKDFLALIDAIPAAKDEVKCMVDVYIATTEANAPKVAVATASLVNPGPQNLALARAKAWRRANP